MIRYWKIISITIISIFAIGAFYIQSALAENNYPDFTFTTKSGDEEAVKNLILEGTYYGEGEQAQDVTTQTNGTAYSYNNSLLDLINPYYIDPEIKRLQKEYRNFMRGKENNIAPFYEDEKLLVYADVDRGSMIISDPDFTFDIEVLEKDSDETEAFELEVPEKNKYAYIHVENVQMTDGELRVITRQSVKRKNQNEFHVYRFDVSTQKLISDDLITSYQNETDTGWSYTDLISSSNTSGEENKYIAFVKTILEDVQGEGGEIFSEEVAKELVTYNLETKQMKSTKLPDEINGESYNAVLIGTMIYFSQQSESSAELIAYNIESEEIDSSQTIDLLSKEQEEFGLLMKIHEGKMYVANLFIDRDTNGEIAVIELDTGEIVYEGFVNVENPKAAPPGYELFLNEIKVQ